MKISKDGIICSLHGTTEAGQMWCDKFRDCDDCFLREDIISVQVFIKDFQRLYAESVNVPLGKCPYLKNEEEL